MYIDPNATYRIKGQDMKLNDGAVAGEEPEKALKRFSVLNGLDKSPEYYEGVRTGHLQGVEAAIQVLELPQNMADPRRALRELQEKLKGQEKAKGDK